MGSPRAMELTESCIRQNPANYTVWEYRRRLVKELGLSVDEELEFTKKKMGSNPKNYQMWHHRSVLLGFKKDIQTSDIEKELELVQYVISHDSKNYHAWQHRICLLQTTNYQKFFNFNNEVTFAHKLIADDYRNNSAWNYLHTLHSVLDTWSKFDAAWLERCIFETNKNDLQNEAAWSFTSGSWQHLPQEQKASIFSKTIALVDKLTPSVPHVIIVFLLDTHDEMKYDRTLLKAHVHKLETSDPVRLNYWKFVNSCLV